MPNLPPPVSPPTTALPVDRSCRVAAWPASAESLFGLPASAALGREAASLFEVTDEPALAELRHWRPSSFHATVRRGDGSMQQVGVVFEPVATVDGASLGLLRITGEPQGLANAGVRYQSIVAALQEGVVVQDRGGRILSSNAAAQRILGRSADQLAGRTSVDPIWRATRTDGSPFPGEQHPTMETLRTGAPLSGVIMGVHHPATSRRWISINSQPIFGGNETSPEAVVATFVDVTEARQRIEELDAYQKRLEFVIAGSNDGYWDWDTRTGQVFFSARWLSMLGYSVGDVTPNYDGWAAIVHADDMPTVQAALQEHLGGRSDLYRAEFRARTKDGDWRWVQSRGKIVERDASGKPIRVAGTHTDITAQREVERELREALDNVKQLSGLLPVCAWCKNVRNDRGYWQKIELYLAEHTDARFTHGMCPDCRDRIVPQK